MVLGAADGLANSFGEDLTLSAHGDVSFVDDNETGLFLGDALSIDEVEQLLVAAGSDADTLGELESLGTGDSGADTVDISVESGTADLVALAAHFSEALFAGADLGLLVADLISDDGADSFVELRANTADSGGTDGAGDTSGSVALALEEGFALGTADSLASLSFQCCVPREGEVLVALGSDALLFDIGEVSGASANALVSEESLVFAALGNDALLGDSVVDFSSGTSDSDAVTSLVDLEAALAFGGEADSVDSLLADSTSESEALSTSEDATSCALDEIALAGLLVELGEGVAGHALAEGVSETSLGTIGDDVGSADAVAVEEELAFGAGNLGALAVSEHVVGGASRSNALVSGEGPQLGAGGSDTLSTDERESSGANVSAAGDGEGLSGGARLGNTSVLDEGVSRSALDGLAGSVRSSLADGALEVDTLAVDVSLFGRAAELDALLAEETVALGAANSDASGADLFESLGAAGSDTTSVAGSLEVNSAHADASSSECFLASLADEVNALALSEDLSTEASDGDALLLLCGVLLAETSTSETEARAVLENGASGAA